jgi:hypothetical protein
MKLGLRTPSLRKSIAARTSWRRFVRHNLGLKAPRGFGWLWASRHDAQEHCFTWRAFNPLALNTVDTTYHRDR